MKYRIARFLFWWSLKSFFRRVEIQGVDRIPASGPVLFVSNHTNAFVDPLVVLTGIDRQVTLTAKHTITRNPLMAAVVWMLDVVLLKRAVDRKNDEGAASNRSALAACVDRLREGGALFIFPEGVSHSDPAMRDFKTGPARIVADYFAAGGDESLQIVPIGLYFSNKSQWRSDAVALVGTPVRAVAWKDREPRALTDAMREWIENLTSNFATEEERQLLSNAQRLLSWDPAGPEALERPNPVDANQRIAMVHRLQRGAHWLRNHQPDRFQSLAREGAEVSRRLRTLGVAPSEVSLSMHPARAGLFVLRELEVMLVGGPLALVGALLHLPPYLLTRTLVRMLSEDEDHPASNAVFLSVPIFLLWWGVLFVTTGFVAGWWWGMGALFALPYLGMVNLHFRDRAGGVVRRASTFLLWLRKPDLRERLQRDLQVWQEQLIAVEDDMREAVTG